MFIFCLLFLLYIIFIAMKAGSSCITNCTNYLNVNYQSLGSPPMIKTHALLNKKRPIAKGNNHSQQYIHIKDQTSRHFRHNSSIAMNTLKNQQKLSGGYYTPRSPIKISKKVEEHSRDHAKNPQKTNHSISYIKLKMHSEQKNICNNKNQKEQKVQFISNKSIKQMKQKVSNHANKIVYTKTCMKITDLNQPTKLYAQQNLNYIEVKQAPMNYSSARYSTSATKLTTFNIPVKSQTPIKNSHNPIINSQTTIIKHIPSHYFQAKPEYSHCKSYSQSKQQQQTGRKSTSKTAIKKPETSSSVAQKLKVIFNSSQPTEFSSQMNKNQSTLCSMNNSFLQNYSFKAQERFSYAKEKQFSIIQEQKNIDPIKESLKKNPPILKIIKKLQQGRLATNSMATIIPINFLFKTKQITPTFLEGHSLEYKIFKAADICSRIFHPNLVRIFYAFYRKSKHLTICTQYADNNLDELIKNKSLQNKILDQEIIRDILKDILQGLSFMHNFIGVGIVHGNVKPKNILISNGRAKLQWLGYEDSLISPYIAPQIKRGQPPTLKSDIWSVGVIAFELAYGELPDFLIQQLLFETSSLSFQGKQSIQSPIMKIQKTEKKQLHYSPSQLPLDSQMSSMSKQAKINSFFEMKQMVQSNQVFSNESIQKKFIQISQNLKDFIQKTMADSMYGRMTASQCLSHPFFKQKQ